MLIRSFTTGADTFILLRWSMQSLLLPLRDRRVCRLRKKRLLSEVKLKNSKALEIAVAMETAIGLASDLQSEN